MPRSCPPAPTTQSVTLPPVANSGSAVDESRSRQGSGVPLGVSSVKSRFVPMLSKAPDMSKTIIAAPDPQVRRSSGYTSSSWQP
jgi:hypothetical protein